MFAKITATLQRKQQRKGIKFIRNDILTLANKKTKESINKQTASDWLRNYTISLSSSSSSAINDATAAGISSSAVSWK